MGTSSPGTMSGLKDRNEKACKESSTWHKIRTPTRELAHNALLLAALDGRRWLQDSSYRFVKDRLQVPLSQGRALEVSSESSQRFVKT